MEQITQRDIEKIRIRAKNYKAESVILFSKYSISYLDKIRNSLQIISLSTLGYFGTIQKSLSSCNVFFFSLSIFLGLISYAFSYLFCIREANFYSDLEKNLSKAFPTMKEYKEMMGNEDNIRNEYKNKERFYTFSIISLILQIIILLFTLFSLHQKS